ncbi:putative histone-arginine methyltransferase 1.3, partial [Bienertia sinuspersici]
MAMPFVIRVIDEGLMLEGASLMEIGGRMKAGAKHVYAVEASEMADYARKLVAGNPILADRITVVKGKVEEVELPEKADILISEPMGTLLVNERMLESYIIARDRFLVPSGKMFPGVGRIHMAPFSDEYLFAEIANK